MKLTVTEKVGGYERSWSVEDDQLTVLAMVECAVALVGQCKADDPPMPTKYGTIPRDDDPPDDTHPQPDIIETLAAREGSIVWAAERMAAGCAISRRAWLEDKPHPALTALIHLGGTLTRNGSGNESDRQLVYPARGAAISITVDDLATCDWCASEVVEWGDIEGMVANGMDHYRKLFVDPF